MADNKLSGNGKRRVKLIWTRDMRITLDILKEDNDLTWATRAAAFNKIYDDYTKTCGFVEPVSSSTLKSQCSNAEKRQNKSWIEIATLMQTAGGAVIARPLKAIVEAALASLSASNDDADSIALSAGRNSRNRRLTTPLPGSEVRLSERTPIAFWDPPTTPQRARDRSCQSRHCFTALAANNNGASEDEADADGPPIRQPKRSRAARAANATEASKDEADNVIPRPKRRRVLVSRPPILRSSVWSREATFNVQQSPSTTSHALTPPRTPRTTSRKYLAKSPYHRPEDITLGTAPLQLTEFEHARTQEAMIPVTKEKAHPPMPGLCYRYWPAEAGQVRNTESGFLARKFARCVPMHQPPPRCEDVCWVDIWDHINRNEVLTPFVSVSTAFWWILRLALKDVKEGVHNGRLSIIDTSRIDRLSIFHAPPYHAQTKKKYVYRDGAQRYPGTHEYLIWREIPGNAIIKTLRVSDNLRFANIHPIVGQALAFDLLPQRGAFETKILPELRARNIELDTAIIKGMAKLVNLLGLNSDDMNQLSSIVSDIIQGWAIHLPRLISAEWAAHATTFEKQVCQSGGDQLSLHHQAAKLGFLDGLRWGCSKHWNTRHSPEKMRLMQKQAKLVGLDDPVKILTDELDAVKLRLKMMGRQQTRLLYAFSLPQANGGQD